MEEWRKEAGDEGGPIGYLLALLLKLRIVAEAKGKLKPVHVHDTHIV